MKCNICRSDVNMTKNYWKCDCDGPLHSRSVVTIFVGPFIPGRRKVYTFRPVVMSARCNVGPRGGSQPGAHRAHCWPRGGPQPGGKSAHFGCPVAFCHTPGGNMSQLLFKYRSFHARNLFWKCSPPSEHLVSVNVFYPSMCTRFLSVEGLYLCFIRVRVKYRQVNWIISR